ncbi:sialidase [Flavobacterium gilvum]|uniref:Sialidase n=2 Tax=Flavobacterium gilvum TaxID=1492737 RepID=A0AAC9N7Y3_9FLAO|nr:sialidase [Flavobacterium gilvum]
MLLFILSIAVVNAQNLSKVKLITQSTIFPENTFKSCHASTLVELSNHRIMASWFAGDHEGAKDVAIWTSILENGKWSQPKSIGNGIQNDSLRFACWNPVLFKNKKGKLFLFYKVGPNPREWWGEMKVSNNDGKTWGKAKKLPNGILGPIKNKPIQLQSGKIIHPSSTESVKDDIWKIHLEISDNNASKWNKITIDNGEFGLIQPTIMKYPDGSLQMLCRSRQNVIVETWSKDEGLTWSKPSAISLPNPNSGIDAAMLKSGSQILAYNPMVSGKDWWLGRSELRLAISKDGKNWTDIYSLENHEKGEYSYPAVIQSEDGNIHISYTDNRKNIHYVSVKID